MYRVDVPTASPTLPAPSALATEGYFTNGNGSTIPRTILEQDFMNMLMMTVLGPIDAAGIAHSKTDFTGLLQAIRSMGFSTGDTKFSMNPTTPAGWVRGNDGTIGSAASGASTRANADTSALYTALWNGFSNALAPVTGGRGASAAADFAANKPMQTGILAGRVIGATGSGVTAGTLTPRALGDVTGTESIVQAASQVAAHRHLNGVVHNGVVAVVYNSTSIDVPGISTGEVQVQAGGNVNQGTTSSIVDSASGAPAAPRTAAANLMQVMQPTTFLNLYIKL